MLNSRFLAEIRQASRSLVRELGVVGARHPTSGYTVTESHALVELDLHIRLRLGELADRLVLDKSTTSRALSTLKRQRLVTERKDKLDSRAKLFALTPKGRQVAVKIHSDANMRVEKSLEHLAPTERDAILSAIKLYARCLERSRKAQAYTVRPIKKSDNAALVDVIRDVRVEHGSVIGGEAPVLEPEEEDMFGLHRGTGLAYFVVVNGIRVVGGGGIGPLPGGDTDVCELRRMYFLPEARGLGLGREVLAQCLAAAKEIGYRACYAETMAAMHKANRLYEGFGFRYLDAPVGQTGHEFTDSWLWLEPIPTSSSTSA